MSQNEPGELHVEKTKRRGISPVWFVPIIAAILGGLVAWRSLANQGPLVEIVFEEAKGIQADKTEIKHKDVVIGLVEDVSFADGLDSVIVTARLDPDSACGRFRQCRIARLFPWHFGGPCRKPRIDR